MIHDLDKTIRTLIHYEMKLDEEQISFEQPTGEWSGGIARPTLNFFLYDVRENNSLRRHQWQSVGDANGGALGALRRTPLFMDCFYLVTAWGVANDFTRPFVEHELLSKCMLALARYPILNPTFEERRLAEAASRADRPPPKKRGGKTGAETVVMEKVTSGRTVSLQQMESRSWLHDENENLVRNQRFEIYTRLAQQDVMTNPAELWSALENQIKAGFSYVVTLQLDPWSSMVQMTEPVRTVEIRTGQPAPKRAATVQEKGANADRQNGQPAAMDAADAESTAVIPAALPIAAIDHDSFSADLLRVGGHVVNRTPEPPLPATNLPVTIMDAALLDGSQKLGLYRRTRTDHRGRFSFRRLQPGEYVILVGPDQDNPLATENVVVWSSQDQLPAHGQNLLIEIEVELP